MLWVSESFVVVTMRGVLVLLQHTLSGIMAGRSVWEWRGRVLRGWRGGSAGMAGESFVRMGESMVAVLVLRDNTASFPRRRESMVAVLVLRDNTASFPRRRESIEYDSSSDVGWAKRSVPNALEVSIPDVCQSTCLNCQAAKSDVPTPAFSGYWSRLCRVFPWLCLP